MIDDAIQTLPTTAIIVQGEASGADTLAKLCGERRGCVVESYPANWNAYGKAAGIIRNIEMLRTFPDVVWAFHDTLDASKGTKHMVTIAKRAHVPVVVFHHHGLWVERAE